MINKTDLQILVGRRFGFIFFSYLRGRSLSMRVFTAFGFLSVFLVDFLLLVLDGLDLLVMTLGRADNLGVGDLGAHLFLHLLHLQAGDVDADLLGERFAVLSGQVNAHLLVLGGGDGDRPVLADGPWSLSTNFTRSLCDLRLGHHGADLLLDGVASLHSLLPAEAGGDLLHGVHGDLRAGLDRDLLAFSRGVAHVARHFLTIFLGRKGTGGVGREVR